MNGRVRLAECFAWMACVGLLPVWVGCGDAPQQKLAPAKGKVVFNGQPVEGGSVSFRPLAEVAPGVAARPAAAEVQQDGTFVLTTFQKDDGATVGKCQVTYLPRLQAAKDYDDKPPMPAWAGALPKDKEIEVQAGQNDFTIELVKPGQAAPDAAAAPPANQ